MFKEFSEDEGPQGETEEERKRRYHREYQRRRREEIRSQPELYAEFKRKNSEAKKARYKNDPEHRERCKQRARDRNKDPDVKLAQGSVINATGKRIKSG